MASIRDLDYMTSHFENLYVSKSERVHSLTPKNKPKLPAPTLGTMTSIVPSPIPKRRKKKSKVAVLASQNCNIESYWTEIQSTWEAMNLDPDLLRGLLTCKMEKPSAVQQRGILPCQLGRDVILQAQSGTGKTATFSIAALSTLDKTKAGLQILVLAPTRELARQIEGEIKTLAIHMTWVKTLTCVGGTNIKVDKAKLSSGANIQILIGTPGRILDILFQRNLQLNLDLIKMVVIDEADEMLMIKGRAKGLRRQIEKIFEGLNGAKLQKIFVSATMPQNVEELTRQYMTTPVKILVKNEEMTLEGIVQVHVEVGAEEFKFETLVEICQQLNFKQGIAFCNRRLIVQDLATKLSARLEITVEAVHGQMDQGQRFDILGRFRRGQIQLLITSDLCGRGIDFPQVSLVINYDLPPTILMYIHRVGRGGRFGRKALAVSFVMKDQKSILETIEQFYFTTIPKMPTNISQLI